MVDDDGGYVADTDRDVALVTSRWTTPAELGLTTLRGGYRPRMSAERPDLPSPDADGVFASLHQVVVPTDADDDALAVARVTATRLAAEHGWSLVLYDRSDERWTDTPHPSGPLTRDQVPDDRRHLGEQMDEIAAAGVDVTAWLSTVPSLTAVLDVVQELDVDGVVVPADADRTTLVDRLTGSSESAAQLESVVDRNVGEPSPVFMTIDGDGNVTITRT